MINIEEIQENSIPFVQTEIIQNAQTVQELLEAKNIPSTYTVLKKESDGYMRMQLDEMIPEQTEVKILAPIRGG